jgi:hypothetical protein
LAPVIASDFYLNLMIVLNFKMTDKGRQLMDRLNRDFAPAEESAINALVTFQDQGRYTFNQRGIAKFFPQQEAWETTVSQPAKIISPSA